MDLVFLEEDRVGGNEELNMRAKKGHVGNVVHRRRRHCLDVGGGTF